MWPCPHAHRKYRGYRASKSLFAFSSNSNAYGNWATIPNASGLLLPLQNTCPDNFPEILKALLKLIPLKLVHLLLARCPEAKIQSQKWEQARKWCQDINSQVTFYLLQASSVMMPGCCTELPASLLAWSTLFGVTTFIPWRFRQKGTLELNLNTEGIIRLSISL